jgi:hypothetical protein
LHSEFLTVRNKFSRAVHRIDHPNVRLGEPFQVVRFFFGKNCMLREFPRNSGYDQPACLTVRRGYGIAWGFPVNGERPMIVIKQDRAGFKREFFRSREFRFHWK